MLDETPACEECGLSRASGLDLLRWTKDGAGSGVVMAVEAPGVIVFEVAAVSPPVWRANPEAEQSWQKVWWGREGKSVEETAARL